MAVAAAAAVTWCALASATEKLLALVTFRVTVPSARPRGDRTRNTYSPWSLSVTITSVSTAWWQYSELPACKRKRKGTVLISKCMDLRNSQKVPIAEMLRTRKLFKQTYKNEILHFDLLNGIVYSQIFLL